MVHGFASRCGSASEFIPGAGHKTLRHLGGAGRRSSCALAGAGGSKDQISEARAVAHQIAGAGASIGFDRLSDLAAALERMLDEVLEAAQPASREQLAELAVLAADLEREARHMKPEHSRLYNLDPAAVTRTGT